MAHSVLTSPFLARLHWCFITIIALRDQIRQMMWQLDLTIPPNLTDLPYVVLFLFTSWVAGKTMEEQMREK